MLPVFGAICLFFFTRVRDLAPTSTVYQTECPTVCGVPDVADKVPDVLDNVPDVADKMPDMADNMPDIPDKTPDVARSLTKSEAKRYSALTIKRITRILTK